MGEIRSLAPGALQRIGVARQQGIDFIDQRNHFGRPRSPKPAFAARL
ncbi:hypothetical protein ACU4HD_27095 [Cupriavidus basilensis]